MKTILKSLSYSLVGAAMCLLPMHSRASFILNPSFEQGPTGITEVAAHWRKINEANQISCGSNCGDGLSYAANLGMDPTLHITQRPVIYTPVTINPNDVYNLMFQYRSALAATVHPEIRVYLVYDPANGANLTSTDLSGFNHQLIFNSSAVSNSIWIAADAAFTSNSTYNFLWVELYYPGGVVVDDNQVHVDAFDLYGKDQLCIGSFAPYVGATYLLSGWASEANTVGKTTLNDPAISVVFGDANNNPISTAGPFAPSGAVIDGWQRIEATFTIPANTAFITLRLINNSGVSEDVFFDDIRIFPSDGNLVSYVYDPINLRLVAELDDNNYATLYEYDEEGHLIRLKRETERGVMTVTETRQNTHE